MAGEGRKSFLLRMDPQLWRELEAWAQEDFRSVNGQIEFLLRRAVAEHRARHAATAEDDRRGAPPATDGT